jgi:hypothetical protein
MTILTIVNRRQLSRRHRPCLAPFTTVTLTAGAEDTENKTEERLMMWFSFAFICVHLRPISFLAEQKFAADERR